MAKCISCGNQIGTFETSNKGRCYHCAMDVLSAELGYDPRRSKPTPKPVAKYTGLDLDRSDFQTGFAIGFALSKAMTRSEGDAGVGKHGKTTSLQDIQSLTD